MPWGQFQAFCYVKGCYVKICYVKRCYVKGWYVKVYFVKKCYLKRCYEKGCYVKGYVKSCYVKGYYVKGYLKGNYLLYAMICGINAVSTTRSTFTARVVIRFVPATGTVRYTFVWLNFCLRSGANYSRIVEMETARWPASGFLRTVKQRWFCSNTIQNISEDSTTPLTKCSTWHRP